MDNTLLGLYQINHMDRKLLSNGQYLIRRLCSRLICRLTRRLSSGLQDIQIRSLLIVVPKHYCKIGTYLHRLKVAATAALMVGKKVA